MPEISSPARRRQETGLAFRFAFSLLGLACLGGRPVLATSVVPISDAELYRRADVIVHGIVLSSDVTADDMGRPETVTLIEPMAVLKGRLTGSLVLHQLGGALPDGRFFQLWGRPEYVPGREVVVFAVARPQGEYQTAELLLGKFEVWQDENGNAFAVPDLAAGFHSGVEVLGKPRKFHLIREEDPPAHAGDSFDRPSEDRAQDEERPRELASFLASLRAGVLEASAPVKPSGRLEPVLHALERDGRATAQWGNISNSLFRWSNNATATWTISGTANMDGGGIAEARAALASWTNDPNSTINYVPGSGTSNVIYVNATSSILGCGWTTCLAGGGVIGCGGPTGVGGSNTWRGETYMTITQGVAELRASCAYNGFGSTLTQAVLTHELGHTLGLGHSDQNVSMHDVCRGDEDAAMMRSLVQNRTTLGTDDQDAIRWLYGDGRNSCAAAGPVRGDFDFNGKPDLLWRHDATGADTLWSMNGTTFSSAIPLAPLSDTSWQIVATVDFDLDGKTDIVWRHSVTGSNMVWLMDGTALVSTLTLPQVDPSWTVGGIADFNGDGRPDILWRHSSGANGVWLMNGTVIVSAVGLPSADPQWTIAGVGDFDGDGKTDIFWRHSSGSNGVWLMNGTTLLGAAGLPFADPQWTVGGVGDFNGDGKIDIVWRHQVFGLNGIWLMNGTTISSVVGLPSLTDSHWHLAGPR